MDPNNKPTPQFKKYCSFCHKNNHSVSTCFRRINMLKESKPQSRSPTHTFYQHFKNTSNKSHYSRYRSRSHSNPSRRSSRETQYQSRSYSRSHSRPRYNIKTPSRSCSSHHNRDRSRDDKHYNQNPYKSYTPSRTYYNSNSSRSPSKCYPRSRERSSNFSSFHRYNSLIVPLLNHAMIVIEADPTQIQIIILNPNTNHPLILPIHLPHLFKATLLQKLILK